MNMRLPIDHDDGMGVFRGILWCAVFYTVAFGCAWGICWLVKYGKELASGLR